MYIIYYIIESCTIQLDSTYNELGIWLFIYLQEIILQIFLFD